MQVKSAVLQECGRNRPYIDTEPIKIEQLELDSPGPDEVLVSVQAAGVCHSDLSVVNGSRTRPVPLAIGHEASGIVLEVGSNVTDVSTGQKVTIVFMPHCGKCESCIKTDGSFCDEAMQANVDGTLLFGTSRLSRNGVAVHHHSGASAFSSATVVHKSSVVPIADDVPFEIASLLGCAVLTGGGAVKNAGKLQEGEEVTIIGAGGVGFAATLVAQALGASRIVVIDPVESKREQALKMGADEVYHPSEIDDSFRKTALVVDATGVPVAFEQAVFCTANRGRTVSVGLPSPEAKITLSPLDIVFQSKTIIGSYHGSGKPKEDIATYIDLWREGKLHLQKLVSDRIQLEDLNEAFDRLADASVIRQVILIGEEVR